MEMITVTAKTVEDAITQASLQLGVSSDRIQLRSLKREVPGFSRTFWFQAGSDPCEEDRDR